MPRLGIELNNVCNLDCAHCFRNIYRGEGDKSGLFLPLETLDKILREATRSATIPQHSPAASRRCTRNSPKLLTSSSPMDSPITF